MWEVELYVYRGLLRSLILKETEVDSTLAEFIRARKSWQLYIKHWHLNDLTNTSAYSQHYVI